MDIDMIKGQERFKGEGLDVHQRLKLVLEVNGFFRTYAHVTTWLYVATLTWPSVGVKPNTWKSWGFGVLWDSRMFKARQQGPKHLALGCSWCHWKGLEA